MGDGNLEIVWQDTPESQPARSSMPHALWFLCKVQCKYKKKKKKKKKKLAV